MTIADKSRPGFFGWKNAAVLFFIYMFTLGMVFYGYSAIFPAMITDMNWNRGTASIAHTLNMLLGGLLVPLAAFSMNKIGTRNTMRIGLCFLLLTGLALGTLTSRMWQWIVLWGVAGGIGFAFAGLVSVQTPLMYWFNKNRAMAIGIVMTGAPAGGFLAQPLYTWLISRNQTWAIGQNWTIGWITGAFFVLAALALSFLVVNKPGDIGQHPDGADPEKFSDPGKSKGGRPRTYRTQETWLLKEVMKTPVFWLIVVFWISHVMPIILITSHGVLHFTDVGFTGMQAASILSFLIMASGISRFPSGWLGDRIEPRLIIAASLGLMVIAYVGLWKFTDLKLMIAAGFLFGLCHGAQIIMFPAMIGNYFGAERFAAINGAISPLSIGFSALVPVGGGFLFEKTGSYDAAFIFLILLLAIGFSVSFFLSPPGKKT